MVSRKQTVEVGVHPDLTVVIQQVRIHDDLILQRGQTVKMARSQAEELVESSTYRGRPVLVILDDGIDNDQDDQPESDD